MTRVLVLDGRSLSALSFVRSLSADGVEVHVGESFASNVAAYSTDATASHVYPSPGDEPAAFRAALLDILDTIRFDLVVPTRDATTRALAALDQALPAGTATLLSAPETIDRLGDKASCARLAERVGVPIPTTYDPTERAIDEIAATATFPVLVKPTRASGARGIARVDEPAALAATYRAVTDDSGPAVVQEYVDHAGGHYSIGTVFDRSSEPRAIHVYEELTQYPDSGGPAVEARSVPVEPWVDDLLEILRAVDWVGPAHMDVLFDPEDRTYKLLEVNPRLWMSVGLTISAGVDVPALTLSLATGGDPEPVTSYRTDLRYRWVLPSQLLWVASGDSLATRIKKFLAPRDEPVCYGVLSRRDPHAVAGVAAQSLSFLRDAEKRAQVLGRGE
ncbi:putative ATP-grasp enzyme [Halovivax ruber XH-70]|uniref:Putative ATP-grasp enzyme n=1 Tax=Halovivax ruber (strain DSM 18193 / JCM 13892 / XH-70) TaxID=797302 RepID=L0ID09_HALRX|nr:ATP-grasp domain-containing protein [Halovivax ruber]AGB17435.1 putative ATP-grasp enzyme [Halovivax ruber XH-70]